MRFIKNLSSVNLKAGIIVLAIASFLFASCASHNTCPAYNGYKKHSKR